VALASSDVAYAIAAADRSLQTAKLFRRRGLPPWLALHGRRRAQKARRWTAEEDEFLSRNADRMSVLELTRELGRTTNAVHIRLEHHARGSLRGSGRYLSLRQIERVMGEPDGSAKLLVRAGRLRPERRCDIGGGHTIWRVPRINLLAFLQAEQNFPCYDPGRFRDEALRQFALRYWRPHRWLTLREAAAIWKVDEAAALRWAMRAHVRTTRWPNWLLHADDVHWLAKLIRRGWFGARYWQPGADGMEFMRRCSRQGMPWAVIARMAGSGHSRLVPRSTQTLSSRVVNSFQRSDSHE